MARCTEYVTVHKGCRQRPTTNSFDRQRSWMMLTSFSCQHIRCLHALRSPHPSDMYHVSAQQVSTVPRQLLGTSATELVLQHSNHWYAFIAMSLYYTCSQL
jgi:hypothetical protein